MVAKLNGSKGSPDFLKKKFLKALEVGERVSAAHYDMEFVGYPDMTMRIDATQFPPMKREVIEGRTAMGVALTQQGNPIMHGELTTTLIETLTGASLKFIRKLVMEKIDVDIVIRITPESLGGEAAVEVKLLLCAVGSDAVDLANESVTELIKVPLVINYNWIDMPD